LFNDINEIFAVFNTFGYLGILFISFLGSIIILVPIPYSPILIAAAFNQQLNPNLISLSGAVGTF
jgi:membrane protein DedA with SNARE-associated domain